MFIIPSLRSLLLAGGDSAMLVPFSPKEVHEKRYRLIV